jgi:hypothetical protein
MKVYRGVEMKLHSFYIPALNGGEWSVSGFGHFTPGKVIIK